MVRVESSQVPTLMMVYTVSPLELDEVQLTLALQPAIPGSLVKL
jgi:hypothetical protein